MPCWQGNLPVPSRLLPGHSAHPGHRWWYNPMKMLGPCRGMACATLLGWEEANMYVSGNPKTKKELKERVARGEHVEVFSPGPFPAKQDGIEYVEGPQYPAPHA